MWHRHYFAELLAAYVYLWLAVLCCAAAAYVVNNSASTMLAISAGGIQFVAGNLSAEVSLTHCIGRTWLHLQPPLPSCSAASDVMLTCLAAWACLAINTWCSCCGATWASLSAYNSRLACPCLYWSCRCCAGDQHLHQAAPCQPGDNPERPVRPVRSEFRVRQVQHDTVMQQQCPHTLCL